MPVCPIFPIIFEGTNFRKIDQNSRNSRNQSYFHENWFPHDICSLKIFCYVDMRYSFPKKKKNSNERYKALIKKQQKEAAIPWCSPEKLRNTSQNYMENINNGYIFKYGCRVTSKKGLDKVIGTPLGKYLITQIALTSLNHFRRMFLLYTPWKSLKTRGFLTILGGIEIEHLNLLQFDFLKPHLLFFQTQFELWIFQFLFNRHDMCNIYICNITF